MRNICHAVQCCRTCKLLAERQMGAILCFVSSDWRRKITMLDSLWSGKELKRFNSGRRDGASRKTFQDSVCHDKQKKREESMKEQELNRLWKHQDRYFMIRLL